MNHLKKIALFTMAVGNDHIYFDSVARYHIYNKNYFGQSFDVDYYLFTDQDKRIPGITNIPCKTTVWPYTTMLKNNFISDYLSSAYKWIFYDYIFFIDADFAIGDYYDFFSHDFILVKPYWNNKNGGGFFYGGKVEYFRQLCDLFYGEMHFIYENKLSLPRDLDEFYLGLFREEYESHIHIIEMDKNTNTLIFFDNEDLDKKIEEQDARVFMQPYKSEGRANKTMIIGSSYQEQECIVNLNEQYIFNNYSYDFGRLVPIDKVNYRILWAKQPEKREVLNIETNRICKKATQGKNVYSSPAISVLMFLHDTRIDSLKIAIESTLSQTFTDFEFIIIDNGSTNPACMECINTYKDKRIRFIQNHHNFINSLNTIITELKGEYIAFVEPNTQMMSNRLYVQYEFMQEHPEIDVCGSWAKETGDENTIELPVKNLEIISLMLFHNTIIESSIFLRKNSFLIIQNAELYKGTIPLQYYKLLTDFAIKDLSFANIPQKLIRISLSGERLSEEDLFFLKEIQSEYAENIMEKITRHEKDFLPLFDSFVELFNDGKIQIESFLKIIYRIYLDFLKDQSEKK